MDDSNSKKLLDVLKGRDNSTFSSASKKDSETVILGKMYNFLVKNKEDKKRQQQEIDLKQKQIETSKESSDTLTTSDVSSTVTPMKKDSDGGFSGALSVLGIVSAGVGVYVFSKEIQEKIDEIGEYFKESTWTDQFQKIKDAFDFDSLLDKMSLGDVSGVVSAGAELSGFDPQDLAKLTQGGTSMMGESEFKQIQSQHKELEGKAYTDVGANLAAQGFKAKDIQKQLGTTDIAQTYAAEQFGVESTKKLYAARDTESAAALMPEVAQTQRSLFYDESGKERTVGQVKETIAQRTASRKPTGEVEQILATIRQRESNNNYSRKNSKGSASGAYQFIDSTWQSLAKGVPGAEQYQHASDAPPEVQDAVARKYVEDILRKSGGDITAIPKVWYTGNIQGKMSSSALAANNGYTVDKYVEHWMQAYQGMGGKGPSSTQAQYTGLISTQVSPIPPEMQMPTATGGNISGLTFAPGVDTGISAAISDKMRVLQNAFGKKLTITSGFRSPERNAKVGGAKNSAHMRGNAVDVSTAGMSMDDKIKLIQVASAVGIGGIGVYSSGGLHFDIEGKRAWGDDYHMSSLPQWAAGVIAGHLQGNYLGSLQNIQPVELPGTVTPTQQTPSPLPQQERKQTGANKTVIIAPQTQVTSVVMKKKSDPTNIFGNSTPQDAASYGIRGQ